MAAAEDLYIDQFATFKTAFRWQTKGTGEPVDLTGYQAKMQIRRTPGDPVALVTLDNNDGIIIEDSEGRVRITIPAETTSELAVGRYVYDLLLTSPADDKKRLVEGVVIVDAGVTR